jgi:hypothetical protein
MTVASSYPINAKTKKVEKLLIDYKPWTSDYGVRSGATSLEADEPKGSCRTKILIHIAFLPAWRTLLAACRAGRDCKYPRSSSHSCARGVQKLP